MKYYSFYYDSGEVYEKEMHRLFFVDATSSEDFQIFECDGESSPYNLRLVNFESLPLADQENILEKLKERYFYEDASDSWGKTFYEVGAEL